MRLQPQGQGHVQVQSPRCGAVGAAVTGRSEVRGARVTPGGRQASPRCRRRLFMERRAVSSTRRIAELTTPMPSFTRLSATERQEEEAQHPNGDSHKVTGGTPRLPVG